MCVLLGIIFTDLFSTGLRKIGLMQLDEDTVVDEKIGEYFEAISVADRKRWYAQELHSSSTLGISTMGKWSMEKLRTAVGSWRLIKNAPNYEILSNVKYQQSF